MALSAWMRGRLESDIVAGHDIAQNVSFQQHCGIGSQREARTKCLPGHCFAVGLSSVTSSSPSLPPEHITHAFSSISSHIVQPSTDVLFEKRTV